MQTMNSHKFYGNIVNQKMVGGRDFSGRARQNPANSRCTVPNSGHFLTDKPFFVVC
jgi:hypothetical protein